MKIKIKEVEVEIWPKRSFNRYSDRMLINFSDLQYDKRVSQNSKDSNETRLYHELVLRSLVVRKEPLKQFESALMHFPLFEL